MYSVSIYIYNTQVEYITDILPLHLIQTELMHTNKQKYNTTKYLYILTSTHIRNISANILQQKPYLENSHLKVYFQHDSIYVFVLQSCSPEFLYGYALQLTAILFNAQLMRVHASGVAYNGRAYLFVGESGMGKTTICLELVKRGFEFLTDDISLLDIQDEKVFINPIAQSVNLTNYTAALFGIQYIDERKRLLPVSRVGGVACSDRVLVDSIILLTDKYIKHETLYKCHDVNMFLKKTIKNSGYFAVWGIEKYLLFIRSVVQFTNAYELFYRNVDYDSISYEIKKLRI